MPLKFKYAKKEEVPAEHAPFYAERDGAWVLDAEGVVEKSKVDEVRNSNAGLLRQLEEANRRATSSESEQVRAVAAERDALSTRLAAIQIDQGVVTSASKRGLRTTAIPDITARARSVFKLVNGVPTAFENDGNTVRVGKDGIAPLTLEEWVNAQATEAPHLFESNAGGGAAGVFAHGHGSGGGKNPWKREHWNVTEQMKLLRNDPGRAEQMRNAV